MKRLTGIVAVVLVLAAGVAIAQQPSTPPSPTPGHQMPQGGGMCPMMGGMMSGGGMMGASSMMGMMGEGDPRTIQIRGEMMKAMGEVMMKYGKMMEGTSR